MVSWCEVLALKYTHNKNVQPTFFPFRQLGIATQFYPNYLHSKNAADVGVIASNSDENKSLYSIVCMLLFDACC